MNVPFNRDSLLDQINAVLERQPQLNLFNIGQLISSLDLSASLSEIPLNQLARVPTPAVLEHQDHFAVLEGIEPDGRLRLLEPELGPLLVPPSALIAPDAERLPLLLFHRRPGSKERRFSWAWYGPYLAPHRQELIQVLACTAVTTVLGIVLGASVSWWFLLLPVPAAGLATAAIAFNELRNKGKSIPELLRAAPAIAVYYHVRLAGWIWRRMQLRLGVRPIERVSPETLAASMPRPPRPGSAS